MSASFFMAANSGKGFFSLFDEIHSPREGWKLYVIKGGPGTGKSSLMKKIAEISEEKGYFCERIFCSSDPDSLDGVVIPALKVSIADGTSPHIIEPKYPGVSEKIINLGECWDEKILKKNSEHIFTLVFCFGTVECLKESVITFKINIAFIFIAYTYIFQFKRLRMT